MAPEPETADFSEYRLLFLHRMDEQSEKLDKLAEQMSGVRAEITTLKVKSSLWGAMAGAIPALVAAFFWLLNKR